VKELEVQKKSLVNQVD